MIFGQSLDDLDDFSILSFYHKVSSWIKPGVYPTVYDVKGALTGGALYNGIPSDFVNVWVERNGLSDLSQMSITPEYEGWGDGRGRVAERERTHIDACASHQRTAFDTCVILPPNDWHENKCGIKENEDDLPIPSEQVAWQGRTGVHLLTMVLQLLIPLKVRMVLVGLLQLRQRHLSSWNYK